MTCYLFFLIKKPTNNRLFVTKMIIILVFQSQSCDFDIRNIRKPLELNDKNNIKRLKK